MAGQGESVLTALRPGPIEGPARERETLLTTFTADASSALGGPDWLVRRPRRGLAAFAASSFPTEAEEVWRYSGIDALRPRSLRPRSPGHRGIDPDRAGGGPTPRRLPRAAGGSRRHAQRVVDVSRSSPASLSDALVVTGVSDAPSPVPAPEPWAAGSRPRRVRRAARRLPGRRWCTSSVARKAVVRRPRRRGASGRSDPGPGGCGLFPRLLVNWVNRPRPE